MSFCLCFDSIWSSRIAFLDDSNSHFLHVKFILRVWLPVWFSSMLFSNAPYYIYCNEQRHAVWIHGLLNLLFLLFDIYRINNETVVSAHLFQWEFLQPLALFHQGFSNSLILYSHWLMCFNINLELLWISCSVISGWAIVDIHNNGVHLHGFRSFPYYWISSDIFYKKGEQQTNLPKRSAKILLIKTEEN